MAIVCLLLPGLDSAGQEAVIALTNPSFEGEAKEGSMNGELPKGWFDCGFPGETVPDIHPKPGSAFQVTKDPASGNTYIGMVVRENDTWERISQRLSTPLEAGKCYRFSMALARSEHYISASRANRQQLKNYNVPAKLRIWGGNDYCERSELLDESPVVEHYDWERYSFRFQPRRNHAFLVLEVFYKTPSPFPYNGNILLDDASDILVGACDNRLMAENAPSRQTATDTPAAASYPRPDKSGSNTAPASPGKQNPPSPTKKRLLQDLDRSKIRRGQTIRMEQVYFKADSPVIIDSSFAVLDELYRFLAENSDVIIEIGGHTNGLPEHEYCDKLSTARARAVVEYLQRKGIPGQQLTYKGYGKRRPVAPNNTEQGRLQNQRVEIRIMSFSS
ncbi:MAG: hypothetical protein RLY31_2277 [Bacteroidota bacterium]